MTKLAYSINIHPDVSSIRNNNNASVTVAIDQASRNTPIGNRQESACKRQDSSMDS